MDAVWPGLAVEEGNLTVQISALRKTLDQGRAEGSCIQTVPGRGYRFRSPVTHVVRGARGSVRLCRRHLGFRSSCCRSRI